MISIMDGFKFTIRFDAWELEQIAIAHKRAPVIAVTANVTPDNVCKCKSVGMVDSMSKPVTLKRLRKILIKWLPGPNSVDA